VPKAAVRHVDGRDIVWIVRDGKVERRAVKVGTEQGDRIAIEAGVSDGERVVVEGPDDLTDGAAVTEAKR
jgi:multidrug efflux pump subunit AcrA (membrane-fusion protein)